MGLPRHRRGTALLKVAQQSAGSWGRKPGVQMRCHAVAVTTTAAKLHPESTAWRPCLRPCCTHSLVPTTPRGRNGVTSHPHVCSGFRARTPNPSQTPGCGPPPPVATDQLTFIHLSKPPSLSSYANWVTIPISQGGAKASGRKQGRSQWDQDGRGCRPDGSLTEST